MPLPNATDQCGFNVFESCNCGDQCKSATVPLSKWNDMSGVFTVPARIQIAFIAWVTITGLIGFGAYQLHQIDKQEQIARNV